MRFSSASLLLFPLAALASEATNDCLVKNSQNLSEFADCGHQGSLAECLSKLSSLSESDIKACYTDAGCSPLEAYHETEATLKRCHDLAKTGELKKRYRAAPMPTLFQRADASTTKSGILTGSDCFTTGKHSTSSCDLTTSGKKTITGTCVPTTVDTSSCAPTMICTIDAQNADICMEIVRMDIGGIIITLVFAGALVIGTAALTWASCKDRKQQKRLAAKAEAVALARAATKKQRAAQRQPLIRKTSGSPSGAPNPFQDQARV
ncbi:hypothetical protein BGZ63DRAFT_353101 [Mariannaea sp. PMI_226]|nr:hypothetical protein BGZ63DRAFT_353101 [Mariannaea sp. PMI_226]